ncbi:MAG: repeat-containing protein, partial [Gemmatimonadetes bacterium]|nr:repeat-containing protein [Gemmatimonadota bacterium]
RRAVAIAERYHGVDTLDTNHILGGLAMVLGDVGEVDEAERLFRRVLAVYEGTIGNAHPVYASAVRYLGRLLTKQERWAEAEPLIRQALAIIEKVLDETHPDIVLMLSTHTHLLSQLQRPDEEEPLARRLLAIAIRMHGADHPEVAWAYLRLGICLEDQGKLDESEECIRRALAITEAHPGANAPHAFTVLGAIARVVFAAKRYDEAALLYERAIDASDPADASQTQSIAFRSRNWGLALRAAGRNAEAEDPLRRTLHIAEQEFPPGHFVIARGLIELARVLESLDRREEAASLLERARAIVEELPEEERANYDCSPARVESITNERDGAGDSAVEAAG